MKSRLFYMQLNGKTRLASDALYSDVSGVKINEIGYIIRCFSKDKNFPQKTFVVSYAELKDIKENKIAQEWNPKLYDYFEYNIIIVVNSVPKGARLFVDSTPSLRNSRGDLDVFSVADKQIEGEETKDKTVFSNRKQFMKEPDSLSIEERDKKLLERDEELNSQLDDFLAYLKELQSAVNEEAEKLENNEKKKVTYDDN